MVGRVGRSEDRGSSPSTSDALELSHRSQEGIARCRSGDDVHRAVKNVESNVLAWLAAECDDVSKVARPRWVRRMLSRAEE